MYATFLDQFKCNGTASIVAGGDTHDELNPQLTTLFVDQTVE